jgi:plasmid stabilization system protein ParE
VSRVTLHEQAHSDLIRLTDFLFDSRPEDAEATADVIVQALRILEHQPLIGRRAGPTFRELVIHRGGSGYLALYRVSRDGADVEVLAIRHQRESGYHSSDL